MYNFGKKRYELADWLGNVRVVINDKKTPQGTNASDMTYAAQTISVSDYYPFGMLSRNYYVSDYRYGFNRKENDDEIIGEGRWQDYGARMYRPDLGRFFSPDPLIVYQKKYPWYSSYQFAGNKPVWKVDIDGLEEGDPEKIITAAANAVNKVKESDKNSMSAKCNIGVNCAFTELTGSNELKGKTANEMFDYMSGSSNFTPIDISEAQAAANKGDIIIAAWKNSTGHGHVALVVPGTPVKQGTWNGKPARNFNGLPLVMDTGFGKRTKSQPVNYSFGKDKQSDVVFFMYKPKISTVNSDFISNNSNNKVYGPIKLSPIEIVAYGKLTKIKLKTLTKISTIKYTPTIKIK